MKNLALLLLAFLATCYSLPVFAGGGLKPLGEERVIPQAIYSNLPRYDSSYPRWIAADALLREDGSLDEELVHPANLSLLRRHLDISPVDGCIRLEEFYRT
jgi:hypothetical protein